MDDRNSRRSVLPLPTRIWSEDKPHQGAQTPEMFLVEKRLLEMADKMSARLGVDRRCFLQSSCGMAAAFLAMNAVFGPLFRVGAAEAADPAAAAERSQALRNQRIFDVQTHFVHDDYPGDVLLDLREMAKEWAPSIEGDQTLEKIQFENFFEEVFLQSDTELAVLSNAPNDDPQRYFLTNADAFAARDRINEKAGSKRFYVHALFTPGKPGWLEEIDELIEARPDAWKGYTTGQPFGVSKYPWRMDDEKLVYPVYQKMLDAGITTVCVHKGLLPENYREEMADTWEYGTVDDLPRAARDWPQLNFLIYHSALHYGGIPSVADQELFERTGYIPWVSDLARMREEHGLDNIYAELGSVFAITAASAPRFCAGMVGTLIKGLGEDRVLWGTDSVWYGSPQWQIEAFRRLEIPEDLQRKFGFAPLGRADGSLKNRIFATNAQAVYAFETEGIGKDNLSRMKEEYRRERG
jgi:uncharacterized protein